MSRQREIQVAQTLPLLFSNSDTSHYNNYVESHGETDKYFSESFNALISFFFLSLFSVFCSFLLYQRSPLCRVIDNYISAKRLQRGVSATLLGISHQLRLLKAITLHCCFCHDRGSDRKCNSSDTGRLCHFLRLRNYTYFYNFPPRSSATVPPTTPTRHSARRRGPAISHWKKFNYSRCLGHIPV